LLLKLNPIEPPWYGPVCPVVWEGRRREVSPYPDLRRNIALREHSSEGPDSNRSSRLVQNSKTPATGKLPLQAYG
jgi:hypothetical protein